MTKPFKSEYSEARNIWILSLLSFNYICRHMSVLWMVTEVKKQKSQRKYDVCRNIVARYIMSPQIQILKGLSWKRKFFPLYCSDTYPAQQYILKALTWKQQCLLFELLSYVCQQYKMKGLPQKRNNSLYLHCCDTYVVNDIKLLKSSLLPWQPNTSSFEEKEFKANSNFELIWIPSTDFNKTLQHQISWKSVQWKLRWHMGKCRGTDGHNEANRRFLRLNENAPQRTINYKF
jgi:hypothetical protein